MQTSAVQVDQVSKWFGCKHPERTSPALNAVTANFPAGQVIGLLGHNGAGKSTLIKLILGLIKPSAGEIRIFNLPTTACNASGVRRRLAYLPENVAFYGNLTGREVMCYFAALKRVPETQGLALLEKTGLSDAIDKRVQTYSKGMRQRLGLAQTLLGAPELLLLDEPTTGLDPMAIQDFYRLVQELRREGRTIIISSHLLAELEPYLDHAVILGKGHVLACGNLEQMRASANLPLIISVRVDHAPDLVAQHQRWRDMGVRIRGQEAGRIEFEVPEDNKMNVVRALAGDGHVTDIEVREPTLARLYARMGGGEPGPGGDSHA